MQTFLDLKRVIDVFIYVLRSNTGYVVIIFAMIGVQLYGTANFFNLLMGELKAQQIHDHQAIGNIGYLFACCLEAGIFATAIWGHHRLSITFAFASGLLSLASFKQFFINHANVDWTLSIWINFVGIAVIAIFPATFIATLSYHLYKRYEAEGFKSLEDMLAETESYFEKKKIKSMRNKSNLKVSYGKSEKLKNDYQEMFNDAI